MKEFISDWSVAVGAIRNREILYMIATQDNWSKKAKPHAIIVSWWNGKGGQLNCPWNCTALAVARHPKEQVVAVGEWGGVQVAGAKDDHTEEVKDGSQVPEDRGTLRCATAVEGLVLAAGMDRQVYLRDGRNHWTCMDKTMRPPPSSDEVVGFEAIAAASLKDITAVGWDGAIFHFDGKKWREEDSGTNLILSAVCYGGDGYVYAAGQRGMLLRGRKRRWEVLDSGTRQNLFGLAWFNDKLYASSQKAVFTLEAGKLELVDWGEDIPSTCYMLAAGDGFLCSFGAKDVMRFDGTEWSRLRLSP